MMTFIFNKRQTGSTEKEWLSKRSCFRDDLSERNDFCGIKHYLETGEVADCFDEDESPSDELRASLQCGNLLKYFLTDFPRPTKQKTLLLGQTMWV